MMAGTMIRQHCSCSLIWSGTRNSHVERSSSGAAVAMAVSVKFSGCTNGPLWIAGSVGGLPQTVRKDN